METFGLKMESVSSTSFPGMLPSVVLHSKEGSSRSRGHAEHNKSVVTKEGGGGHHWIRKQEYNDWLSPLGQDRMTKSKKQTHLHDGAHLESVYDASSSKRKDLNELKHYQSLVIAFAHSNSLRDMNYFHGLRKLRKIDLAFNVINSIPHEDIWKSLPSLQILYLHGNDVSDPANLTALRSASSLIHLTLYGNPIAHTPGYRQSIVNMIPFLKALDQHVVTDGEIYHASSNKLGGKFTAPCNPLTLIHPPQYQANTSAAHHIEALSVEIKHIMKVRSRSSPSVQIQKHIRGWAQRRRLKKQRDAILTATLMIQKWCRRLLLSRRVEDLAYSMMRELGIQDYLLDAEAFQKLQAVKVLQRWYRIKFRGKLEQRAAFKLQRIVRRSQSRRARKLRIIESQNQSLNIYYFHRDEESMHDIVSQVMNTWTSESYSYFTGIQSPYITFKYREQGHFRDAEFVRFCKSAGIKIRKEWLRNRLSIIKMSLLQSQLESNDTEIATHLKDLNSKKAELQNITMSGKRISNLPRIVFGKKATENVRPLSILKRRCLYYSKAHSDTLLKGLSDCERLIEKSIQNCMLLYVAPDHASFIRIINRAAYYNANIFSEIDIKRNAAITSIQASWRAHKARKSLNPPLLTQVLYRRASICIQRWWRAIPFFKRMIYLRCMWKYLRKIKEAQTMVLYIEDSIFRSVIDVSSAGMLDAEISRYSPAVKSTVGFSGPAVIIIQQSHGIDMCRNGIPRWTGVENVQTVISGSIKEERTSTSAINYIITQRSVITTELITSVKNYTSKFLRIEFPTKEEAVARSAALFAITWNFKRRCFASFFTLNDLTKTELPSQWVKETRLKVCSSIPLSSPLDHFRRENFAGDTSHASSIYPSKPTSLKHYKQNNQSGAQQKHRILISSEKEYPPLICTKSTSSLSSKEMFHDIDRKIIKEYTYLEKRGNAITLKMDKAAGSDKIISDKAIDAEGKKHDVREVCMNRVELRNKEIQESFVEFHEERRKHKVLLEQMMTERQAQQRLHVAESSALAKQAKIDLMYEKETQLKSIKKKNENSKIDFMRLMKYNNRKAEVQAQSLRQAVGTSKLMAQKKAEAAMLSASFSRQTAQLWRATRSEAAKNLTKIKTRILHSMVVARKEDDEVRKFAVSNILQEKFEMQHKAARNQRLLMKNMCAWRASIHENEKAGIKIRVNHAKNMKKLISLVKAQGNAAFQNPESDKHNIFDVLLEKDIIAAPSTKDAFDKSFFSSLSQGLGQSVFHSHDVVENNSVQEFNKIRFDALWNSTTADDSISALSEYADKVALDIEREGGSVDDEQKALLEKARVVKQQQNQIRNGRGQPRI